jgi:hypothetical protein
LVENLLQHAANVAEPATEKLRASIFSRGEKFVVVVGGKIFITH